MKIYDRIYGEFAFPPIIQELLDCPGLLRLRDVRMANNQFASFPAFSNASRYEHSLGVCYLAQICAKSLELSEKDSIELMMAGLYHDVGTPPFAHAMEEVLQAEYGFDHEENLKSLIEGRTGDYAGKFEQVYFDASLKLQSICQSKQGRKLNIDVYRIAKLIVGDSSDPLSILLNGKGMDLDNIDNIVRASTAMGIIDSKDCELAIRLASSFIFDSDGKICHDAFSIHDIRRWQQIRDIQYTAIFDSVEDFAYQTMIKKALRLMIQDNYAKYRLNADSWKLTDAEILYNYLMKNQQTSIIMKRVLLFKPYKCLGIFYITGNKIIKYINEHIDDIERATSEKYESIMGLTKKEVSEKVPIGLSSVLVNFYPDKRKRQIRTKASMMGEQIEIDETEMHEKEGALLGLFTPILSTGYRSVIDAEGNKKRKVSKYTAYEMKEMMEYLMKTIFTTYEVSIYGKRNKSDNEKTTGNQLGLF